MPSSFLAGPHSKSPPLLRSGKSGKSFSSHPRCLSTYSWNTHGLASTLLRTMEQQEHPKGPVKSPQSWRFFHKGIPIFPWLTSGIYPTWPVFKRNRIYYISPNHHFSTSALKFLAWRSCIPVLQTGFFVTAQMIDFCRDLSTMRRAL